MKNKTTQKRGALKAIPSESFQKLVPLDGSAMCNNASLEPYLLLSTAMNGKRFQLHESTKAESNEIVDSSAFVEHYNTLRKELEAEK